MPGFTHRLASAFAAVVLMTASFTAVTAVPFDPASAIAGTPTLA